MQLLIIWKLPLPPPSLLHPLNIAFAFPSRLPPFIYWAWYGIEYPLAGSIILAVASPSSWWKLILSYRNPEQWKNTLHTTYTKNHYFLLPSNIYVANVLHLPQEEGTSKCRTCIKYFHSGTHPQHEILQIFYCVSVCKGEKKNQIFQFFTHRIVLILNPPGMVQKERNRNHSHHSGIHTGEGSKTFVSALFAINQYIHQVSK